MAEDPAFKAHQEWIRPLGGEGLVVSATALTDALVFLPPDDRLKELSAQFEEALFIAKEDSGEERVDLPLFEKLAGLLGWEDSDVIWDHKEVRVPDELSITIDGTTIKPTHVLVDSSVAPAVLVIQLAGSPDLLQRSREGAGDWDASHAQRMERLLREKKVEIGIIITATEIRLFYVPATGGENPGSISFPLSEMRGVRGRPTLGAVFMLLERARVVGENTPEAHRLLGLMRASREAQNRVSEELADQVLGALYELIKGIQVADQAAHRKLISKYLNEHPEEVYHGLLNVLMRLIFMLYAEDRGIMPQGGLWQDNYEVHGLFERLQKENVQHAGNMDKRYGAWGQLLTTFKVVHDGCQHPSMKMPARMGYLFDPRRYPFVSADSDGNVPLVSDAVVLFVLKSLLVVKGERISYRSLNVENIGVVYETMMGFSIYQSKGSCVVMKGAEAPVAVELEELMAGPASSRAQVISDMTGWKPNAKVAKAIKEARDTKELLVILEDRIRKDITPTPLAAGGLTLQPGEERRRSGSHYTPRALTEPLVSKAFEPHFARFGEKPTPEQILSLTVCDPAMGSGAFLVEATRQLAAKLVEAWKREPGKMPKLGAGDDVEFVALRMIAQRCIYGVDRNPMAVDLAKLSLWLLTISKDHPFTFMDHSLKHGDALVGMSREQIRKFHWDLSKGGSILPELRTLDREVEEAVQARLMLRNLDADRTLELEVTLAEADRKMIKAKQAGDLLVYIWFSKEKDKARNEARDRYTDRFADALQPGSPDRKAVDSLRFASKPLAPFHWELEFPEVFTDKVNGFAVFVGNPPFAGTNTTISGNPPRYLEYLTDIVTPKASGKCDLVGHFIGRAYSLLSSGRSGRTPGTMNLIATKTVRQGQTREASLARIVADGGIIYCANRRLSWPGKAAVVIATVAIAKGDIIMARSLDGKDAKNISSFLIEAVVEATPGKLRANANRSFEGSKIYGGGFLFEDDSPSSTPISVMKEIMERFPECQAVVQAYVGGDQVNNQPVFKAERFAINFGEMNESQARRFRPLWDIVEAKVKPDRHSVEEGQTLEEKRAKYPRMVNEWWKYWNTRPNLYEAIAGAPRVLVANCAAAKFLTFSFLPPNCVYSNSLFVFADSSYAHFAAVQSRVHELWARMFGSSLEDRLRYTGTTCYENFPLPGLNDHLEGVGKEFYEVRSKEMESLSLGLTPLGNRINCPEDHASEVVRIRKLHAAMDKAVLDAYGWSDIVPAYEFSGDYENEDGSVGSVRLNFTEEVRDEILRRLLALHAERIKAEQSAIPAAAKSDTKAKKPKKSKDSSGPELF
jgi:hypothetical protein